MPPKALQFSIIILIFTLIGLVRYAVIWSQEQATQTEVGSSNEMLTPVPDDTNPQQAVDGVQVTKSYTLPVPGSAPTESVKHTIELTDIKRGCFVQDCIPSVVSPEFLPANELREVLEPNSLGIAVWEAQRFYPFPMLETHELVNDVLPDGSAVLVSYCPLCGTGIVFNRELYGVVEEFGVSGMLWQSNLLMYNRNESLNERNLWSQILGQAVVGNRAGEPLEVVESDIVTYAEWLERFPTGETLVTGEPQDPYQGKYVDVALQFDPDFSITDSAIPADTYVHGIIVAGQPKAYVTSELFDGMTDIVNGERIFVQIDQDRITFLQPNAESGQAPTELSDTEGFWFSWQAAHPNTELWTGQQ